MSLTLNGHSVSTTYQADSSPTFKRQYISYTSVNFSQTVLSIHSSIFYTHLIRRSGHGGAGAYPSGHRARGRVQPGQVASPSQGHTITHTLTLTPKDNLESPINLTCMFLDGGRKPEYLERTEAYTGRTGNLHTEPGLKPGTLSL